MKNIITPTTPKAKKAAASSVIAAKTAGAQSATAAVPPATALPPRFFSLHVTPYFKKFCYGLGGLVIFLSALIYLLNYLGDYGFSLIDSNWTSDSLSDTSSVSSGEEMENCNVSGIILHGSVVSYIPASDYNSDGTLTVDETASENLVYQIEQAEANDEIKAIVLEIDSLGGSPVAGEEVANALKAAKKPTVALIRGAGDSAAYWAASGADKIFASKNSDVGSIGVTMSYLDAGDANKSSGLNYNQLSSGKYKDTGDPDKALTADEKGLLMRDIKILYQNFIQAVADNRSLPVEKVTALADGSTMLGEMALQNGLIDFIGGEAEVKNYLTGLIGEQADICW